MHYEIVKFLKNPFPVDDTVDEQCKFKKPNLPEVTAHNVQRNGSHLNSDNLQITLDIQFQCKRVKNCCQFQ